ncbi:acyltransferase family protein [Methylosinus sp. LW4]|uniref:acyltransferase family protein n=1 Tax=Methylosinus sp. LW4 TaxID=136993 RepID=UPI0003A6FA8A|nr:acyltransferase [Methylosinus sp. LW4]
MNFYPIWPYFVTMAAILAIISSPLFCGADGLPGTNMRRQEALDGIRGFLAFGVFFGHGALYHRYIIDGSWGKEPVSPVYTLLAEGGVVLFFMITGYLFWGKLLDDGGRPNWIKLYIGRLFRIGPLYLIAIAAMVLIVGVKTDFLLRENLSVIIKEIGAWLLLGAVDGRDINGYKNTWQILAGVTWTLAFEWKFYISLFVLAIFSRNILVSILLISAAITGIFAYLSTDVDPMGRHKELQCMMFFLIGMMGASLERANILIRFNSYVLDTIILGIIAYIWLEFTTAYAPYQCILLGFVFYMILSGATLFGILSSTPARRLGNISFGIYILQGIVFAIVFSSKRVSDFAQIAPINHWLVVAMCATLLVFIAAALHVLVELPGIENGRRIAKKLSGRREIAAETIKESV